MRHMRDRRECAVLIGSFLFAVAGSIAAQSPQPAPSSPSTVAPPSWSRAIPMPDGRTFVTDGGLSIDAALARPAAMPSVVLTPASAKLLAGYLEAPYDNETGMGDLRPGNAKNTFTTPDGVALNGNYITFLRSVVPSARTRLRTSGKTGPVVVVSDGKAVAVMMPLQPPR
jgi:hypothetical protein